jgi:hypothetical protein
MVAEWPGFTGHRYRPVRKTRRRSLVRPRQARRQLSSEVVGGLCARGAAAMQFSISYSGLTQEYICGILILS